MIIILTIAVLFGFGKEIIPTKATNHAYVITAFDHSSPLQPNQAMLVIVYKAIATLPTRTCKGNTLHDAPTTSGHPWSHPKELSMHPI